ncbi:hypothetical protein STVA_40720 [Allostella vacuolata]|nr:hypothetical protein STVA_40720 [Stella vacuolata]
MKIQLAAATAAIALLVGAPAIADPAFDPVLGTNANANDPVMSRPGAPSSGERSNDSGEGMPPHSPGVASSSGTYYAPDTRPTYYTQPTYYVPAQPVYYNQPVTVVTPGPVMTSTVVTSGASINGLVGSEVTDMYGNRVGQLMDIQIMPDRRAIAVIGLGSWPGQVDRTIALPLDRMHHSTPGRLAYAATADQIRAVPTYSR